MDVLYKDIGNFMSSCFFQLRFFIKGTRTFTCKLIYLVWLCCFFQGNAQGDSNVKLNLEPGILLNTKSENLGFLFNIEPTIAISVRSVIGLRFGVAINSHRFENNNSSQFNFDEETDHAVLSFVPTYNYYLNENYNRPYLGVGFGYYVISTIDIANPSEDVSEGSTNNQFGVLARGGMEFGRTKIGLEYNFISKAEVSIPNGQIIGKVANSYLGLSIRFTIGGGSRQI
ncbi:hypothetical protein [Flagellimonas flava]|uniref:Outer membrane protein beta-barrel domain-containing protein n=1 Tax=Flagellimonas flava TaxID=570519 RepID=A0A1M5IKG9_9FLAO|nr:hypothetical protein [Allomuricauda flava]SHG28420.1 hypothetical protein SAMN04488116_0748 [Allomuricauda flava]